MHKRKINNKNSAQKVRWFGPVGTFLHSICAVENTYRSQTWSTTSCCNLDMLRQMRWSLSKTRSANRNVVSWSRTCRKLVDQLFDWIEWWKASMNGYNLSLCILLTEIINALPCRLQGSNWTGRHRNGVPVFF